MTPAIASLASSQALCCSSPHAIVAFCTVSARRGFVMVAGADPGFLNGGGNGKGYVPHPPPPPPRPWWGGGPVGVWGGGGGGVWVFEWGGGRGGFLPPPPPPPPQRR